ncbi:hypothetical protein CFE70_006906 [Pyrenophora teres f. teres 0-1]
MDADIVSTFRRGQLTGIVELNADEQVWTWQDKASRELAPAHAFPISLDRGMRTFQATMGRAASSTICNISTLCNAKHTACQGKCR